MKLKLKHKDFCDGCEQLYELHTLAGHKRCVVYKINMLPQEGNLVENRGLGYLKRPDICVKENEVEVTR